MRLPAPARVPGPRGLTTSRSRAWGIVCALVAAGLAASASAGAATPAADCHPFAKKPCLLPFPNNLFTKRDPSSPTGLRVYLPQRAMPTNAQGSQV